MTYQQFLEAARDRIALGWTQEFYARTEDGRKCSPINAQAVCWCTLGAIAPLHACPTQALDDGEAYARKAMKAIFEDLGFSFSHGSFKNQISAWNDNPYRTQQEVIALFDRMLKKCS